MYLKNNLIVDIETEMYRCHDITKTEFNYNLSKFLKINVIKNSENHIIVGDFNIDILYNNISNYDEIVNTTHQKFLNNLLENEYSPCFLGFTRPNGTNKGSCIDNIFIKSFIYH